MIRDFWKNTNDFSAAFYLSMTGQSALVEFSLSSFNSIAGGSHLSLGIPTNCRAVWWLKPIGLTWDFCWQHPRHGVQHILKHITQPGYHFWGVGAFLDHIWWLMVHLARLKNSSSNVFLDGKKLRKIFQVTATSAWGCQQLHWKTKKFFQKIWNTFESMKTIWKSQPEKTRPQLAGKKTSSRFLGIFVANFLFSQAILFAISSRLVNAPKGFDLTSPPECTGSLGSVLGGRCWCRGSGWWKKWECSLDICCFGGRGSGFVLEDFCGVNFSNSVPAGEKHGNEFSKFG